MVMHFDEWRKIQARVFLNYVLSLEDVEDEMKQSVENKLTFWPLNLMILKSFSKINLSLNINKKFKRTKLHDIQTYYCLLTFLI